MIDIDEATPSKYQIFQGKVLEMLRKEKVQKESCLFSYQIEAVLQSVDYFRNSDAPNIGLIQVPTGGGKSGIITLLPYALGAHKVLVLSPGLVITGQLESAFGKDGEIAKSFCVKMGIVKPASAAKFLPRPFIVTSSKLISDLSRNELVIVNAQKFGRNKLEIILNGQHEAIPADIFEDFDTIIVDEAHHYPAKTWSDIVAVFQKPGKRIIFLTATPKPDSADFCGTIYRISREKLVELGIIRKISYDYLNFENFNDISDSELTELAARIKGTLEAQDEVVKNITHKVMVLVRSDKDYTKNMADRFNAIAVSQGWDSFKAVHCISDDDKKRNKKKFDENDHVRIMVVCQMLTEGYDNSDVSVCVILRNIHSDILFNQFVGRCVRTSRNRENLKVSDIDAMVYGPREICDRYERNAVVDPEDSDDE